MGTRYFDGFATIVIGHTALPSHDPVVSRVGSQSGDRQLLRYPPWLNARAVETRAEMEQRLDGAGGRQAKRAHERDDLANIIRMVAGQISSKQAAEAHSDDRNWAALEISELPEPPTQLRQQTVRRPPIDAEVPAEGAIAAALQEHAQRLRHFVGREKCRNDQHHMAFSARERPRIRSVRSIRDQRPRFLQKQAIGRALDRAGPVEYAVRGRHPLSLASTAGAVESKLQICSNRAP